MGHPLELGPYRGLRPLGLAAGASRFTPGLDNPSTIEAQAVSVSLDPLRSLLTRSWVLQFQIHRARVDLRRNSQGSFWQLGRVPAGGQPPPLTLRYGLSSGPAQVRIHGAKGAPTSLALKGSLSVDLRRRRLDTNTQLRSREGGQLSVEVRNDWQRQRLQLQLQPQALKLASLLPFLPGEVQADVRGALNGRLRLERTASTNRCQGQLDLTDLRWAPGGAMEPLTSARLDLRCSPQGLRLASSPLRWSGWRGQLQGEFPLVGARSNQLQLQLQAREPKAGHSFSAALAGPLAELQLQLDGQLAGVALAKQPPQPLVLQAQALLRNQAGLSAELKRLLLRQGGGELVASGQLWPNLQLRSRTVRLGPRQQKAWGPVLGSRPDLQLVLKQLGPWSKPQLSLELEQQRNPLLGSVRSQLIWRPSALRLERFESPYLTAQGPLPLGRTPMGLEIALRRFPLERLSALLGTELRGQLSASGALRGSLQRLRPDLTLQAEAPGFGPLGLDENWVGTFQGLSLRLQVENSAVPGVLQARLTPGWQLSSLSLKRAGGAFALTAGNQRYRWSAERFPLSGFDLALWPAAAPQPLSGYLSGQGALAMKPLSLDGQLRVDQPQLLGLFGRSLQAKAALRQGRFSLDGQWAALGYGTVGIQLKGQQAGPLWLRLEARQLQSQTLQELLAAVPHWGGLPPTPSGRAFDLGTLVFNTQGLSLADQLTALAQAQRQRQRAQSAQTKASLQDLRGVLDADFTLRGPSADRLFVDLAAQGHLWLQGTDRDLALTDQPTVVRLHGPLNQGGEFELAHLPLALLALVAPVPEGLRGSLSSRGSYRLGGPKQRPAFELNLALQNASLNGERLALERGEVTLQNNQLALDWVLRGGGSSEVVDVRGTVPLSASSDALELRIGSRGDGLRFLTALSGSAVQWKQGSADLELLVRGSLLQPVANGFLRFSNGVMALADQTVRDLDAVLLFDFSSLEMQSLSARVGEKGQLSGSGDLNLFASGEGAPVRRLNLSVKQAPFKLARMAAVADGTVEIGGSLLRPVLGGELALSRGAINVQPGELATEDAPSKPTNVPALLESKWDFNKPLLVMGRQLESSSSQDLRAALPNLGSVSFERFRLRFGRDLRVEVPNVLNFGVGGLLTLNGPLDPKIQISGVVRLLRGRLGLFTTTFSLDPDAPNVAVFTPSLGLIPYVDIVLRTRVSDTLSAFGDGSNRSTIYDWSTNGSFNNASLTPNSFDQLQLVRVRLEVTGPADQLVDNIRLSSTPPLPEDRLLALIGGNSLVGLVGGNAGAAVATVVGQSLLSPLVGSLTELLGQRLTFAIYPAYVLPTNYDAQSNRSGQVPSQLVPVTDIGLDVSERFNASVLAAPNRSDIPPQVTLGYQAKPWLGLQTSIDAEARWQTQMQVFFRF